jgi:hypothetical protein
LPLDPVHSNRKRSWTLSTGSPTLKNPDIFLKMGREKKDILWSFPARVKE